VTATPRSPVGPETSSDCARCFALCCVALPFARSADFGADKPAGMPCRHLGLDHRCEIHTSLPEKGYRGCTVFECFGAGQQVSQVTFQGRSWRDSPSTAASMFAVFPVMQALQEMLRHLQEAATRDLPPDLTARVESLTGEVVSRTSDGPDLLLALDVGDLRARVGPVLGAVSAAVRARGDGGSPYRPDRRLQPRADLVAADLRGVDGRGADLRGALLIGADLRGARFGRADLLGADLRGADCRGTDLSGALYLTTPQLQAARTDATTRT